MSVIINMNENKLKANVNHDFFHSRSLKSQGQGHRERWQLRRSHQGLFQCKVSSLYWLMGPRTNLNTKVNQNYQVTLNGKKLRSGSHRKVAVEEIWSRSIKKQSIMSLIIHMNESKLKRKSSQKLLSDLEWKKSWSGSQGKVAVKVISSRSIPTKGIKSVLINGTENKLKSKG